MDVPGFFFFDYISDWEICENEVIIIAFGRNFAEDLPGDLGIRRKLELFQIRLLSGILRKGIRNKTVYHLNYSTVMPNRYLLIVPKSFTYYKF